MSEYFPGPRSSGGRVKAELDLSNYATKADVYKLVPVPVDLSKLSDVGKK